MNQGKIIVIEGACDGIGKTTQYELLHNRLIQEGYNVTTHHFPSYNTYQVKPVEEYLSGKYGKTSDLSPYFVSNLYANDRAVTWHTALEKAFNRGDILLFDRYTTSNLIYQSALIDDIEEKKKFIDYISDLEYNKLGIRKPDKVIFLTAPFDIVTNLRKQRPDNEGIINDVYERDSEFMKKIYDNALFVADYLSWEKVECSDNGKMKDINNIHEKIYNLVKN